MSGHLGPRCLAIALWLLVGGCATVPPERLAREEAMWAAARQCQSRFATIASIEGIDVDGRLRYTCLSACPENQAFEACYREALAKTYRSSDVGRSGHLAATSRNERRTEVPVTFEGNAVFVPVFLNGSHAATLLLDTGATMTLLRPALAQELLVAPARGGISSVNLTIVGGQTVTAPAGRLRSIRVGSLIVEDLDVGVYDAMPARQDVQGLLGGDFLRNFRVTVDRSGKLLILEVP
jgi:predicted aspartyl protease